MARKILIADDSPTVQKKASGILVGEGMEVVTVSNGVAAIKKLPTVNPMVILADVAMPGKDGYEVCEFVKGSKEYSNVPVLLVFSDGDMYDEQRGARAHADGRIKKPFDRDELIATVAKHLAAAEAAATKAVPPPPVVKAPPPPTFVTEPVDAEPEIATKEATPDFSQFGGGVAFAEALDEISATPEPAPVEPAPVHEYAEASEPAPVIESEPPIIEAPVIEPEVSQGGELQIETTPEMPVPSPVEPPPSAEPVYIEEHAAPEHTHEHAHPHVTERTMMFRAPAEIAEPVLSDELEPPPTVEPPPVEPPMEAPAVEAMEVAPPPVDAPPEVAAVEAAPVEEPAIAISETEPAPEPVAETPSVAAATLDSYSLSEAAAGHVHVGHGESVPEPAEPPVEEAPAVAIAQAPAVLDSAQVYSIVYMVVAKMSPRLPPQAIEGIAKPLADEITAELGAGHPKNS